MRRIDSMRSRVRFDRSIDRTHRTNQRLKHAPSMFTWTPPTSTARFSTVDARLAPASLDAAMRVVRLDAVVALATSSSVRNARSRRDRATATRRRATSSARDDDATAAASTLLDELARAYAAADGAFVDLVRSRRDALTLTFFDVAAARVRALGDAGEDVAEARALDEACAAGGGARRVHDGRDHRERRDRASGSDAGRNDDRDWADDSRRARNCDDGGGRWRARSRRRASRTRRSSRR